MKHTPETITETISLYDGGMSLNETSRHMMLMHGISISARTVLNWFVKYSKLIGKFFCNLTVKVKGSLHFDETVLKVKGKNKYYWGAKDSKTRFKFPGKLTGRTYEGGCWPLFKQVKKQCYDWMKKRKAQGKRVRIVSDKLGHYHKGFNKLFRNICRLVFGVPIACRKYGLKRNNNPIERDNERVKQRTKTMRGFKNVKNGEAVLQMRDYLYNFTRTVKALGKTPAEAAGIELQMGRNRILSLINFFDVYFHGFFFSCQHSDSVVNFSQQP